MAATDSPETNTTTREAQQPTASRFDRPGAAPTTRGGRSGRATASMVLGIISIPAALFPILGLIIGVIGLTLGLLARGDIDRRGLSNRGQAVAGIVLNSIGLVLTIANMVAGAIIATS
jgi:hypothetical protein